jgi:indolepyruvate ferredoxin oxidoreductase, alpha subunit
MKVLLSGNEAIALGAWEAGVQYASAYPGTPSTEILENFARYPGVRAEWASNEKVALDNVIGASFGGGRTLAAMKHVGVNVAADSLMSVSYTGCKGGLVLVSADDPGAFSSQNEQDNRQYARFGKFPCFEPADSEDARRFVGIALAVSETFETPVMLRSTTRLSHSKSAVEARVPDERAFQPLEPYTRNSGDTRVIVPEIARRRHPEIELRLLDLAAWSATEGFVQGLNRITWGDRTLGIVTTGIAYQYVREIFPEASTLKLGMSYPLPLEKIREFAAEVELLVVIEELDPFIEEQLRAAGIDVAHGKDIFPLCGEFTLSKVRAGARKAGLLLDNAVIETQPPVDITVPARSPALCPGCPHRAFYFNLRRYKRKAVIAGDIGCYSMGVLPPFEALDMLISMGASVGMAHGFNRAGGQEAAIAVIGDSTFFHSGLPPLASAVYNQSNITVVVLDNRITAMTGQQQHPGTGITLQEQESREIDIAAVAAAMGVAYVEEVDAWDVDAVNSVLRKAMKHEGGPAVVVVRGACVFTPHFHLQPKMRVDPGKCVTCGMCFNVGCPAIIKSDQVYETSGKRKAAIDPLLCTGCTVCMQVCPVEAIGRASETETL